MNMDTLERVENVNTLSLNDIACVRLVAHRAIAFDLSNQSSIGPHSHRLHE